MSKSSNRFNKDAEVFCKLKGHSWKVIPNKYSVFKVVCKVCKYGWRPKSDKLHVGEPMVYDRDVRLDLSS